METEPTPPLRRNPLSTPLLVGMIAGALLAIAFAVAILRHPGPNPSGPRPRGGPAEPSPSLGRGGAGEPSILSPIGTVPHGAVSLHWTPVEGIDQYDAAIYDTSGTLVWRSERVGGDSLDLPLEALRRLTPGPAYFWRVTGHKQDGTEALSPTVRFSLAP